MGGTTTGVWIPEDSDLLERYDDAIDGKRSERIRDAMELQLVVEEALDSAPWDWDTERAKRASVRQAILDRIRHEMEAADDV